MSQALEGLRVLEVAEGISGPYCGKLMACLGAEVVKVEPPEGDAARQAGPFPGDLPNPEKSGLFLYLNTGKKSVALDLRRQEDRRRLLHLAQRADVLVENYPPGFLDSLGLGYAALRRANSRLVMVSITPFGQYGPYRDFKATDMVVHALSGELYLAGRPDREPLKKGGSLAEYHGGLHGFFAALSALMARQRTGQGQHVDVSLAEAVTSIIGMFVMQWAYARTVSRRRGADGQPWPNGVWPARNGYILAYGRFSTDWWPLFVEMMKDVPAFADPRFAAATDRARHVEELDALFQAWLSDRTKEEVYHLAQKHGLPFGYVATAPDLMASPQLQARRFFVEVEHPVAGKLPYPGAPFILSRTPFQSSRAPLLGEHNGEVLGRQGQDSPSQPDTPTQEDGHKPLPLEGVRVLDFSHVWAGPFCARLLGDMGAEVIKVEPISRYDPERGPARLEPGARGRIYPDGDPGQRPYNRAGRFNVYNRSKLGLTLDLRTQEGRALVRELVSISDVIVENFSVGVMKRLGLDYDDCRQLRPDIIYISMPGFGRTGPEAGYVAYGLTQEAMAGLSSITGYPGEVPLDTGVFYGDPTCGVFGAVAAVAALWHRQRTGQGQLVDLSQREAFASTLPELVFEYAMNDRVLASTGNRHPGMAPHGCYRCKGEDAWIAITVTSDQEFAALARAMGHPEWASDPRFATLAARKGHEDELDRLVQGWTEQRDPCEAMHVLQAAGVPAGAVLTNQQLLADPHFQARGFFETVAHRDAGTHAYPGMPWKLSGTPVHVRLPAPCLGQHNDYVLGEVLGLAPPELERLAEKGVIGTGPQASSAGAS